MVPLEVKEDLLELDNANAQQLFKLLSINNPPDLRDFLESGDYCNFSDFFFDVLIENDVPCALSIDWKWTPQELFEQFKVIFSDLDIELIGDEYSNDGTYLIEYRQGESVKKKLITQNKPSDLLVELTSYLPGKKLLEINFLEDNYNWLFVPSAFDIELFCSITGLSKSWLDSAQEKIPENFTEGYRQSKKIFFIPRIVYVSDNGSGYDMPNQHWGGRILPGQTIRQGIATELNKELQYHGHFNYEYNKLLDITKDREGREIKRYSITIYLYDNSFKSKLAGGLDIKLRKIVGRKFGTKAPHD